MSCKANFHVVRSALKNSMCLLCIFSLIRSSIDPTFCGIFVCGPLQFSGKKNARACHIRWHNLVLKNSIFCIFDGINAIAGKGSQIRSPTPIMASDIMLLYYYCYY